MGDITKLDSTTINQIAAGEVIERPASVVKELVENSIDAGAKKISIDIVNGGKKLIRVVDDGKGIMGEELELAFRKHTTSKIKNIDDVYALDSMGFRGEALASISSVAEVETISKHQLSTSEKGKRVFIKGGKILYSEFIPAIKGTSIKVMNLFYNLPARKKNMGKTSTERGHIVRLVTELAMINFPIHFILSDNRKVILNIPSSPDLRNNLFHVLGAQVVKNMLPIKNSLDHVMVEGFVGVPEMARRTRSGQWFFVNRRGVDGRVIREALEDACQGILMRNKYPTALLTVTITPSKMDVNIHPAKRKVRFESPENVYAAVYEGVVNAFELRGIVTGQGKRREGTKGIRRTKMSMEGDVRDGNIPLQLIGPDSRKDMDESRQDNLQTTLMSRSSNRKALADLPKMEKQTQDRYGHIPPYYQDYLENHSRHYLPLMIPLAQAHELYIVAQANEDIILIDQHALAERIMLEKLTQEFRERSLKTQELLVPLDIELTPGRIDTFKQWKGVLEKMGFGAEYFGDNSYRIRYIPISVDHREVKQLVVDIIDLLAEGEKDLSLEEIEDEMLKMTACKSAIKAGEKLNQKGIEDLFVQMYRAENPYFCAHGRPTMVKLTKRELEKRFKRVI